MAISFRQADPGNPRSMFPCHVDELEQLARIHGTFIERVETASDQLARTGIEWTRVITRLPDDGTGALPVIRHIILKDSKSSTYKLALLRVLARIAECSLGLTRSANEEYVAVPLGLVAVFWLRQFKPVLQAGLPQMPTNVGLDGLGFVKDAYRRITHLSHLDFRVAARFTGQSALFLHQAINDVVSNIKIMPAKHTSFPNGPRVYGITSGHRIRLARELVLDSDYLKSFGELLVPEPIWRALTRFNVWIEPALVAEWIRIMKDYMTTQGRPTHPSIAINSGWAVIFAAELGSLEERLDRTMQQRPRQAAILLLRTAKADPCFGLCRSSQFVAAIFHAASVSFKDF